jgi:hypothetical protein
VARDKANNCGLRLRAADLRAVIYLGGTKVTTRATSAPRLPEILRRHGGSSLLWSATALPMSVSCVSQSRPISQFAVAVSVKYSFTCGSRNMNEPEIEEIEQVCKIDPLLNGSTLEKIHYGKSYDLSVRITMPDGKTFEFSQLEDFNQWLARRTPQ